VTECKLLKYEWVTMWTGQGAELKAEKYKKRTLKMVDNLGCENICEGKNYASTYGTVIL
jgi:hypothetical protein